MLCVHTHRAYDLYPYQRSKYPAHADCIPCSYLLAAVQGRAHTGQIFLPLHEAQTPVAFFEVRAAIYRQWSANA